MSTGTRDKPSRRGVRTHPLQPCNDPTQGTAEGFMWIRQGRQAKVSETRPATIGARHERQYLRLQARDDVSQQGAAANLQQGFVVATHPARLTASFSSGRIRRPLARNGTNAAFRHRFGLRHKAVEGGERRCSFRLAHNVFRLRPHHSQ